MLRQAIVMPAQDDPDGRVCSIQPGQHLYISFDSADRGGGLLKMLYGGWVARELGYYEAIGNNIFAVVPFYVPESRPIDQ